jgi:ParB/RepB/Spo0J family partition protein
MTTTTTDTPTKARRKRGPEPDGGVGSASPAALLQVDLERPSDPPPAHTTASVAAVQEVAEYEATPEVRLPVSEIAPSPHNPRKTFRDIEDLAKSIVTDGQLQAIMVRPVEGAAHRWEIIFGERRWRAHVHAGLTTIRARVVALSEERATRIRVVENNQRSDLHPLEEAAGFRDLINSGVDTTASLAEALGRSVEYVQKRLKLLSLEPECREAFLEDRMPFGVALVIARMGRDHQLELLKFAVPPADGDEYTRDDMETVATTRAVAARARSMLLRLALAQFDVGDATLRPAAGVCTACPKNTESARALFAEVVGDDAYCTDPSCWRGKLDAHFERLKAKAELEGRPVLSPAEAKKVFQHGFTNAPGYDSSLVSVDQDAAHVGAASSGRKTVGKLLTKHPEVPRILAQHPVTGAVIELVDKKLARKVLAPKSEPSPAQVDTPEARADRKLERLREEAGTAAELKAAAELVAARVVSWRALTRLRHEIGRGETLRDLATRLHGIEWPKASDMDRSDSNDWAQMTAKLSEEQHVALYVLADLVSGLGTLSWRVVEDKVLDMVHPGAAAKIAQARKAAEKDAEKAFKARSVSAKAGGVAAAKKAKASPKAKKGKAK